MDFTLPPNNLVSDDELSMKYFSDLNDIAKEDKLLSLENLVNLYKTWVDNLETIAQTLILNIVLLQQQILENVNVHMGEWIKGLVY